jgi:hypothetical protein
VGVLVAVPVAVLVGVLVPVGVTVGVGVGTQPVTGSQAPGHTVSMRSQTPLTQVNVVHALLIPQSPFVAQAGVLVAVWVGVLVGVCVLVAVRVGVWVGVPVIVAVGVIVGVAVGTHPVFGSHMPGQTVSIR